jgi:hypothetical protein
LEFTDHQPQQNSLCGISERCYNGSGLSFEETSFNYEERRIQWQFAMLFVRKPRFPSLSSHQDVVSLRKTMAPLNTKIAEITAERPEEEAKKREA